MPRTCGAVIESSTEPFIKCGFTDITFVLLAVYFSTAPLEAVHLLKKLLVEAVCHVSVTVILGLHIK